MNPNSRKRLASVCVGEDGLARRQFVYDGDVQIAIKRHGQRTWNGRGGHHQYVRNGGTARTVAPRSLGPQFRALLHAKTVLLIYAHQPQVLKLHHILNKRMCTDNDV